MLFNVAEKGKGPENKEELITWLKTWQPSSNYSYHNTQQQVPLNKCSCERKLDSMATHL